MIVKKDAPGNPEDQRPFQVVHDVVYTDKVQIAGRSRHAKAAVMRAAELNDDFGYGDPEDGYHVRYWNGETWAGLTEGVSV